MQEDGATTDGCEVRPPAWAAAGINIVFGLIVRVPLREIGVLLPSSQRQHRTLHIQKDVLPYALC